MATNPSNLHSQAMTYARLAETTSVKFNDLQNSLNKENLNGQDGIPFVLPISAEIARLLPKRNGKSIFFGLSIEDLILIFPEIGDG